MQAVNIRTTQNVQLEYPLAGIGERLLAYAIDLFITASFYFVVMFTLNLGGQDISLSLYLIIAIIAYLYRFVMEISFNGQTVGKMALNIKVVKLDGSAPSVAAYLLRWLLEPIDFLITGVAVVSIILTRNGQRIGDLLAGTTVIKIKKISRVNIQNKVIMQKVEEGYVPTFSEAANLTDYEIRVIKACLKAFKEDAKAQPTVLLEDKLKEKYEITSDMTTIKFLYTLMRDHAYYVSQ